MAPLFSESSSTHWKVTFPWERLSQSWMRKPPMVCCDSLMVWSGVRTWWSSPPAKVTTFITEPGSYR